MTLFIEAFLLFFVMVMNRLTFIYVLNRRLHTSFIKNPALTFVYFTGTAFAVAVLFWGYAVELFAPRSIVSILVCLVVITVINPWAYDQLQDKKKRPTRLARANPDQPFLLIEDRYLLSKTGDVIFQQVVSGILILILAQAGIPFETLVPVFAGIFFLTHLHLFFITQTIWALYFSIFAALGAFVLPFLILYVEGGVYYAIAIHTLWYVGSGAFFGFLEHGLKKVVG
jgi:hypothetical protein